MPMHDWTKVPDGIFHAFHHGWIWALGEALNAGRLPPDYYALPEQVAAGLGPDVLTLQDRHAGGPSDAGAVATASPPLARPSTRFMAETEGEFYRRRKKSIAVRHVIGDRVVAVLEIMSPDDKPLTTVSYDCDFTTRAYIEPVAVGDLLPERRYLSSPTGASWCRWNRRIRRPTR